MSEDVGRIRGMLLSSDGRGYSIPKVTQFGGFTLAALVWLAIGAGMAALGWEWGEWQGWFYAGAGFLVGGGVAGNALHRATWKPEADK